MGDLSEVTVGIGEVPGVAAVGSLPGWAGDLACGSLGSSDDLVDFLQRTDVLRQDHAIEAGATFAGFSASVVRKLLSAPSTRASPPGWRKTVWSTSWPCEPIASWESLDLARSSTPSVIRLTRCFTSATYGIARRTASPSLWEVPRSAGLSAAGSGTLGGMQMLLVHSPLVGPSTWAPIAEVAGRMTLRAEPPNDT